MNNLNYLMEILYQIFKISLNNVTKNMKHLLTILQQKDILTKLRIQSLLKKFTSIFSYTEYVLLVKIVHHLSTSCFLTDHFFPTFWAWEDFFYSRTTFYFHSLKNKSMINGDCFTFPTLKASKIEVLLNGIFEFVHSLKTFTIPTFP